MDKMLKIKGFTLAEVLITLGVIGIVAALTIPNLVQSYKKKVVETKLVKFYSMMNQAIALSEVDNGDKKLWWADVAGAQFDEEGNIIEGSSEAQKWFNKYLAPYIKVQKEEIESNTGELKVYFSDGSILLNAHPKTTRDWALYTEDNCEKVGICKFYFNFRPTFDDNIAWIYHVNKGFEPWKYTWDGNKESLKNDSSYGCYNSKAQYSGYYCTALIQLNNWKIPEDYPFRF